MEIHETSPDLVVEDAPIKPAWSSFRLIDGMLIIVAIGIGMSMESISEMESQETLLDGVHPLVDWVLRSLAYASVFIVPLNLSGQFLRGRRIFPSFGEWLGLAPLSLFLAMLILSVLVGGLSLIIWFLAQILTSFIAPFVLISDLLQIRPHLPCRWTDWIGCVSCAVSGLMVWYIIHLAFSEPFLTTG